MFAVLISMLAILTSPIVNAKEGQGTIEKIINCGAGSGWKQFLLFKLSDGNWFGIHAETVNRQSSSNDSNFAVATIMMAFTAKLPVSVRFDHNSQVQCGKNITTFWSKKGNYIEITR